MGKFIIYKKDLRGKPRDSKFYRDLTAKSADAKRILKNKNRLKYIYEKVEKAAADGGVTRGEMRNIIGEAIVGKDDSINVKQAKALGRAIIKSGRSYVLPPRKINLPTPKKILSNRPITARINEIIAARKNVPTGTINSQTNFNRPAPGLRLRPAKISGIGTGARGSTVKKF